MRNNATHFLEVYKSKERALCVNGNVFPISDLHKNLSTTEQASDLKTVAVWFITPKNTVNEQ